jgi:hypothetical protein
MAEETTRKSSRRNSIAAALSGMHDVCSPNGMHSRAYRIPAASCSSTPMHAKKLRPESSDERRLALVLVNTTWSANLR